MAESPVSPRVTAAVVSIVAGVVLIVVGVVLAVTGTGLGRFGAGVGDILDLLSAETKPSVATVGGILRDAVVALVPSAAAILGFLVAAWLLFRGPIAAAVQGAPSTRVAFGRAGRPGVRLGAGRGVVVGLLIAGAVIAAALVALAVTVGTAPVTETVVRGTTLVLVEPSTPVLVAMILAGSLALVPGGLALRAVAARGADLRAETPPFEPTAGPGVVFAGLGLVVLAGLALLAGVLAAPIADDYKYFARIDEFGVLGYLPEHMRIETGRYASALAIAVAYGVFGVASTQVVPVVLIVGLGLSAALVAREFLPFPAAQRHAGPALLGLAVAVVAVSVAPSFFDSYLWLTSSLVYLPPLVLAGPLVVAVRRAESAGGPRTRWAWRVAALVLVAVIQGFNEPLAVLLALLLVILAIVALVRRHPHALFRVALAVVAIGGVLVLGLAPSQADRISDTATGSLPVALAGAFYGPLQFLAALGWAHLVLVVALGALLGAVLGRGLDGRRRALAIGGLLLLVVPLPLSSFISCYGTGWAAWRTYATGGALFATGAVLLVACLVSFVPVLRARAVLRVAAGVAILFAAVPLAHESLDLVRAESLRSSLMATRDAAVRAAVARGDDTIVVTPAPILVSPSDARDFEYSTEQSKDWFSFGYRTYFGIGGDVELEYVTTPPPGYCLDADASPAAGIVSCAELGG